MVSFADERSKWNEMSQNVKHIPTFQEKVICCYFSKMLQILHNIFPPFLIIGQLFYIYQKTYWNIMFLSEKSMLVSKLLTWIYLVSQKM